MTPEARRELQQYARALRAAADEIERLAASGDPAGQVDAPAWARLKVAADLAQRPPDPPGTAAPPAGPPTPPASAERPPVVGTDCPMCATPLVQYGKGRFCMTCQAARP